MTRTPIALPDAPNPTALIVFSRATSVAIRLATDPSASAMRQRQAARAAYRNARAAARAALSVLARA